MAAYRADIEIGVRGARSLEQLRSSINQTARAVDSLNDVVSTRGSLVQNIQNYTNNLSRAARSLQLVGAGTIAETKAVREYVQALGEANAARARQNSLVAQELANQRRVTPGNAGFGQQGPALPPALVQAQQVQQNWNRFFRDAAEVAQELRSSAAARTTSLKTNWSRFFREAAEVAQELQSSAAARTTNLKTNWNRFFQEAAEVAQELQSSAAAKALNIRSSWSNFFQEAQELALELAVQTQRATAEIRRIEGSSSAAARQRLAEESARRSRIQNAGFGMQGPQPAPAASTARAGGQSRFSNVVLGAGFPLLFGGGPGAVLGGAAGGLVGGPGAFAAQIGLSAIGQQLDMFAASAAKTGIALSPLTADVDAIAEALGITGTATAKYIADLKDLERQDEALAVATEEMARLVGDRGVQALRSFGEAATDLSNEWAKAMTQMQAALAGLLTGPLRAVVNQLESANLFRQAQASTDPQIQQLLQLRNRPGIMGGTGNRSVNDITAEIIELQRKANAEAQKREQVENTTAGTLVQQKRALEAQLDLAYTDGDLTNDKVYKLSQILIDKEFEVRLQQAINDNTSTELIQLERKVKLQDLARQRLQAQEAAAEKAQRAAQQAADQQLRTLNNIRNLEISLIQEALQSGDVDVERTRAVEGELAAIRESISQQQARLNLEARILNIKLEQQLATKGITDRERVLAEAVYKEQLQNLTQQSATRQQILIQSEAQLMVDKALADAEAMRQASQPFEDLRRNRELDIQYGKTYLRLVTEGVLPAEAERIANFEKLVSEQLNALDNQIAITQAALVQAEAYGISADKINELRDELERLNKARGVVVNESAIGPGKGLTNEERAAAAIAQIRGELNELADPVNAAVRGANAIGDAFQQAFTGLMTGAMTAQEALASFFRSVGESFVSMAAEIIAKQMVMITLQSILKALGVVSGGGGGGGGGGGADLTAGIRQYPLEPPVPFAPPAFAEGGFVTGPTTALIGEGGEPEYVIPASKMRTAMARYSAGARGTAVIPANGGGGDGPMGEFATAPGTIDVRYTVERINSVDYVTADQFRTGMQEAAAKGAAQGEQRTLRRLQNSTSTRRRLGM